MLIKYPKNYIKSRQNVNILSLKIFETNLAAARFVWATKIVVGPYCYPMAIPISLSCCTVCLLMLHGNRKTLVACSRRWPVIPRMREKMWDTTTLRTLT
jgi:hypothetical protein